MDLSRFSNLPGIDTHNADFYESSDLPEVDQIERLFRSGQDNSEAVERIEISFTDAQKQFVRNEEARDKKDELFQNRSFNFGYFPRSEYEIVNERSLETPTQRYDRLKSEFSEFIQMVNRVNESEDAVEIPNPMEMRESAKMMLNQLQEIHLDKVIKCEESVLDPDGSVSKKLANEISSLKNTAAAAASSKGDSLSGADASSDSMARYEVYVPSNYGGKSSMILDLEKRMAVLEKAIGSTDGKEIATMGSEPNLVSALEKLEEKVFFLDKVNLDMLEMRLQSLMDKLKEIKSKPIPSEKLTKVSEMLEIAQKWDSVADSLPSIVDRLSALDTIHQQG